MNRLRLLAVGGEQAYIIPAAVVERNAGLATEEDQEAVGGQRDAGGQGVGRRAAAGAVVEKPAVQLDIHSAQVEQFDVLVVFVECTVTVPIHIFRRR